MPRNTTEKERKEVVEKAAARQVKQPYPTEIEDREAEKARKEKPASQPAEKRERHHGP